MQVRLRAQHGDSREEAISLVEGRFWYIFNALRHCCLHRNMPKACPYVMMLFSPSPIATDINHRVCHAKRIGASFCFSAPSIYPLSRGILFGFKVEVVEFGGEVGVFVCELVEQEHSGGFVFPI